jgi:hypothetical protein
MLAHASIAKTKNKLSRSDMLPLWQPRLSIQILEATHLGSKLRQIVCLFTDQSSTSITGGKLAGPARWPRAALIIDLAHDDMIANQGPPRGPFHNLHCILMHTSFCPDSWSNALHKLARTTACTRMQTTEPL